MSIMILIIRSLVGEYGKKDGRCVPGRKESLPDNAKEPVPDAYSKREGHIRAEKLYGIAESGTG
jgi:hypothetical protein